VGFDEHVPDGNLRVPVNGASQGAPVQVNQPWFCGELNLLQINQLNIAEWLVTLCHG